MSRNRYFTKWRSGVWKVWVFTRQGGANDRLIEAFQTNISIMGNAGYSGFGACSMLGTKSQDVSPPTLGRCSSKLLVYLIGHSNKCKALLQSFIMSVLSDWSCLFSYLSETSLYNWNKDACCCKKKKKNSSETWDTFWVLVLNFPSHKQQHFIFPKIW